MSTAGWKCVCGVSSPPRRGGSVRRGEELRVRHPAPAFSDGVSADAETQGALGLYPLAVLCREKRERPARGTTFWRWKDAKRRAGGKRLAAQREI